MKIIKPYTEIITPLDGKAILQHIELCGRVSYKSEDKITDQSAENFVKMIIRNGHESVLEHYSFTVRFVVDRGVSHEIVRHRLAAYTQESTRYCNYSNNKFNSEITFIQPSFFEGHDRQGAEKRFQWVDWCVAMGRAEDYYFSMLKSGSTPQEARSVLPNSLKTEVVMTANLREWRHFFKLRCDKPAHPQMREVTVPLLYELKTLIPVVFDDIVVDD